MAHVTPKIMIAPGATTAPPEDRVGTKQGMEVKEDEPNKPQRRSFLSMEGLETLKEACGTTGIPVDSLASNIEDNEGLTRAFLLYRAAVGGIGFFPDETQVFLRKVDADRAALPRLGK